MVKRSAMTKTRERWLGKPSQALDRADDSFWTKRRASYTSMEDAYGSDSRSISFMDAEPISSRSASRSTWIGG